jgi:cyclase
MLIDSVKSRAPVASRVALMLAVGMGATATGMAADEAGSQFGQFAPDDPSVYAELNPGSPVGVIQVVPGIYMMTVQGINVAVQTGEDGTVVVNTGPASGAQALVAAVNKFVQQPVRYVIDTGGDAVLVGGNAMVAADGQSPLDMDAFAAGQQRRFSGLLQLGGLGSVATIIARQNVLTQMVSDAGVNYASAALPTETFARDEFHFYYNEPIAIVALDNAHSDGDSAVRFERSDVVVAGAVFDGTRFPVIDIQHGGSIDGEIAAVNRIINTLAFAHLPVLTNTGGTLIIPIRGSLSDLDDLATYGDMLATVRARVDYYMNQGKTLKQIEAAHPAQDYATRYGADSGDWTTQDFVDAVYNSLQAGRRGRHGAGQRPQKPQQHEPQQDAGP